MRQITSKTDVVNRVSLKQFMCIMSFVIWRTIATRYITVKNTTYYTQQEYFFQRHADLSEGLN